VAMRTEYLDDDEGSRMRLVAAYFIVDVAWRDDSARQQYVASFFTTLNPYSGRVVLAEPGEWRSRSCSGTCQRHSASS
jgi:hypothetical protein